MSNWKNIWKSRKIAEVKDDLGELLKANGYDNSRSVITADSLSAAQKIFLSVINPTEKDTFFEVGCGSGAMLWNLKNTFNYIVTDGIDISPGLTKVAKINLPTSDIKISEAIDIDTEKKYDHVFSFGVFFYFPNIEYTEQVLLKMVEKANKTVSVYDIQDLETKEENEEMRRKTHGPKYDEDYKNLEHLYMSKNWFIEFAERNNCDCTIFNQVIDGYENGKYRFNVTFKLNKNSL